MLSSGQRETQNQILAADQHGGTSHGSGGGAAWATLNDEKARDCLQTQDSTRTSQAILSGGETGIKDPGPNAGQAPRLVHTTSFRRVDSRYF
jgi:hypothetical protein